MEPLPFLPDARVEDNYTVDREAERRPSHVTTSSMPLLAMPLCMQVGRAKQMGMFTRTNDLSYSYKKINQKYNVKLLPNSNKLENGGSSIIVRGQSF